MKTHEIETEIRIGREIFENIPNNLRPIWAGLILSKFNNYFDRIPIEIKDLFEIINNYLNWNKAYEQFTEIRLFNLSNLNFKPQSYLLLAEKTAKITYNASGLPAPFDNDSGHYIPSLAIKTAKYIGDKRLEDDIKSILLLFNRNEKFKTNFEAALDFLVYKQIDDILWYDWDPIGINDDAPRDEYQGYVPEIFNLKKSNAETNQIAKMLYIFETDNMGLNGNFENCQKVAEKIVNIKSGI